MATFEVRARLRVRDGKLDGFRNKVGVEVTWLTLLQALEPAAT